MTTQEMIRIASSRPTKWLVGEALHAGLTLILVDTAASHLRSGDVERATLCVAEAEHSLTYLRQSKALQNLE